MDVTYSATSEQWTTSGNLYHIYQVRRSLLPLLSWQDHNAPRKKSIKGYYLLFASHNTTTEAKFTQLCFPVRRQRYHVAFTEYCHEWSQRAPNTNESQKNFPSVNCEWSRAWPASVNTVPGKTHHICCRIIDQRRNTNDMIHKTKVVHTYIKISACNIIHTHTITHAEPFVYTFIHAIYIIL